MRILATLLRRFRPESEWRPLPYEQAIRVPEPVFRNLDQALTSDGQIAVLVGREPIGRPQPDGQSHAMREGGRQVRRMQREMG